MPEPDYIIELSGRPVRAGCAAGGPEAPPSEADFRGRPWVAVRFRCCRCYTRIYRNREGNAYEGHCPKCRRPVRMRIGNGGTNARFFEAQ